MSFRNRLTSFFVVIVLAPMLAMGILTLSLISQSNSAKATARANGLASAAASVYANAERQAQSAARTELAKLARLTPAKVRRRVLAEGLPTGLVRMIVKRGQTVLADLGSRSAVAPGTATLPGATGLSVVDSTTTAAAFVAAISSTEAAAEVTSGGVVLASSAPGKVPAGANGRLVIGGRQFTVGRLGPLPGLNAQPVRVAVLSNDAATNSSAATSRLVAVGFVAGFALLAFSFAVIASRGLESQVGRFLSAARRLRGGDFSAPVPVEGRDEFAQLANEFNSMSRQLEQRLVELDAERVRLRQSIRRGGETFASTLNEDALLPLALETAVDGTGADFGRISARSEASGKLEHRLHAGSLSGAEAAIVAAEGAALKCSGLGDADGHDVAVLTVPLGPTDPLDRPLGLITVGRRGQPFSTEDRELLLSLAGQASMAIDNTRLHDEARRRATIDPLTELANHGRFQEVLNAELVRARRYRYPIALILLDIDNFKQFNDRYGHPQGDLVLRSVAEVLRSSSRDGDLAARYGGEEMAMVLPHTDQQGSYAIAERLRQRIASLEIRRLDGAGSLSVTASVGVGATIDQTKEALIRDTDAALYRAKRDGKNRTVRATSLAAHAVRPE